MQQPLRKLFVLGFLLSAGSAISQDCFEKSPVLAETPSITDQALYKKISENPQAYDDKDIKKL